LSSMNPSATMAPVTAPHINPIRPMPPPSGRPSLPAVSVSIP
jgi:hypothetical protein